MKDIISDTLFLPLYFRALDAQKSQSIYLVEKAYKQ
ncbi:hypothetical protein SAMN05444853_10319 [Pasteurella skyensis]|uniref:Uncharacterized protein n=1 Tax=Phocoenobacter skyensis TaxID=97481 RepID=A0A1H7UVA0_9PAST|nr:hypothetical protein SAMN05444853_10319 [Pasteurella skyensis]